MNNSNTAVSNKYWIKIVVLFTLGWLVIYATRQVLAPLIPTIMEEFNLSNSQAGNIMSIFFIGYTLSQVPSGIIGDKVGRKTMVIIGTIGFGIFAALTGMMTTYILFIVAWFLVGLFQGMYYGPQYALSSEAIPPERITLGSALINSGMAFGTSIGMYISTITVFDMGLDWKWPFIIISIPVILLGIVMMFLVKERAPHIEAMKLQEKESGREVVVEEKLKIIDLFKKRNLILAFITIFCSIYGFFVILTWLPTYLLNERGVQGSDVAFVTSLVPWAAIPGSLILSWISDKLGRRKPVLLVMLPVAFISMISIVFFDSMTVLYVALILYGLFGKISTNPVLIAVVADTAPRVGLSTSFGVYNFIGMSASILAPGLTGWITDVSGSFNMAFYVAAGFTLVGIIASSLLDESDNIDRMKKHKKLELHTEEAN